MSKGRSLTLAHLARNVAFLTILFIGMLSPHVAQASSKTTTVVFSESTSRSQAKTLTIPHLREIQSITVNTGTVTHSVSGTTITLGVQNGTPVRSVTPSKYVTDSRTSSTNSFSSTIPYNSGGYTGTLDKSGSVISTVVSGSPSDTKSVTENPIVSVPMVWMWSTIDSTTQWWKFQTNQAPSTYPYDDGIYSGTLNLNGTYGSTIYPSPPAYAGTEGQKVNDTAQRKPTYSGLVTKPDTRVYSYTQNYAGTAYGSTTYYYAYEVTITYLDDPLPVLLEVQEVRETSFKVTDTQTRTEAVEYQFVLFEKGNATAIHTSPWQDSSTYLFTNLVPNRTYTVQGNVRYKP